MWPYVSPVAEVFGSVPLQLLVPLVAHHGGPAPGQPTLGDVHMVALHPLRPVATVTAVDETRALQEEGGAGNHGSFLLVTGSRAHKDGAASVNRSPVSKL